MDVATIVTVGAIVLANIGTVIGMFMWATGHAAADTKSLRESMQNGDERCERIIERMDRESKDFRERWAEESKQFHARLCVIEEKRNQILMNNK